MFHLKGQFGECIVYAKEVDQETMSQLYAYLNHPISENQTIRIMPDCHAGKGCVVGFTSTMHEDWVIPNIVGVDIGCGILCANIGKSYHH
jgi:RNA-splicing ligase RtcB